MSENKGIYLRELLSRIRERISSSFPYSIWVKAEISSIKTNYSGHCYMELIDKADEHSEDVQANARAVIWRSSWRIISSYFREVTGENLDVGMNVLLKVQVSYSELYGLSLIVNEIDPSYTLGEAEQKRLAVIAQLRSEGMFDMNTTLSLPRLPHRFAVISSATAAGYIDFVRHLNENEYHYHFDLSLFQAPMQGSGAPMGIISALDEILEVHEMGEKHFDAVLILRGGGSKTDLACFDDYDLAANVAQFPLPVMIAVGHEIDYHVVDMVACVSVKTPTALADYIINIYVEEESHLAELAQRLKNALHARFRAEDLRLMGLAQSLRNAVGGRFRLEDKRLLQMLQRLRNLFNGRIRTEDLRLNNFRNRCFNAFGNQIRIQNSRLDLLEKRVALGNPRSILEHGYTIVCKNGEKQNNLSGLEVGDLVTVISRQEEMECLVKKIKKQ